VGAENFLQQEAVSNLAAEANRNELVEFLPEFYSFSQHKLLHLALYQAV
jgi:hypothetical protein